MMVNKNHPDFSKYKSECAALHEKYVEQTDAYFEKKKDVRSGKDDPQKLKIDKEFSSKLKEIQKKYSYLFE